MSNAHPNSGSRWVCTDKYGNVYITGKYFDRQDFDPGADTAMLVPFNKDYVGIYLAKYDAKGNYKWAKSILAGDRGVYSYDVVVDNEGRVTVAGNYGGTIYYQAAAGVDSIVQENTLFQHPPSLFLMQYDTDGNFRWIKLTKSFGNNASVSPLGGMCVDKEGSIYMGGYFTDSVDFDPGTGTALIVANSAAQGGNRSNGFVTKFDSSGKCIWAGGIGGDGSIQTDFFAQMFGVAVDTMGYVYLTGIFTGSIDFDPGSGVSSMQSDPTPGQVDVFLLKLDKGGRYQWAKRMGGSGIDNSLFGISVGGLGSIYIAGVSFSFDADFDPGPDTAILKRTNAAINTMFVARYDADGNYRWVKNVDGPGAAFLGSGSLMADRWDNVHFGATIFGEIDLNPGPDTAILRTKPFLTAGFLATYDVCGNYTKGGFLIGSGNGSNMLHGICAQYAEEGELGVYVLGDFVEEIDFDPGPDSLFLSPENPADVYLLKVNFTDTPDVINVLSVTECSEKYLLNGVAYTASGKYKQMIPLEGGCDSIILLNLTLSSIEKPFINVNAFVLGVTGSYNSYQWLKNGALIDGASGATYAVTENADYQVIVTNEDGCIDTSDVYPVTNYTSVGTMEGAADVNVYPNPSTDMIYIQAAYPVQIRITDMGGRTVLEHQAVPAVSLRNIAEGMYLVYIYDSRGGLLKVEKIVKAN